VALWTGYTFVGYFTPIRELGADALRFDFGGWSAFWVLFYGFATYGNAGWMREQVCKYMCPYARFQSAMFDQDTLIVTYDAERGEPRGPGSKKKGRKDLGLGDCVDCGLCVQVCPTGIDIRKGLQYECIGCAACIDACDYVMERTGLPKGLIRYSTTNALRHKLDSHAMWRRVLRPRVLLYGALLGAIIVGLIVALLVRVPLKVDVIRDRSALAREVEDGKVENVYRMQVSNTTEARRGFTVSVSGLPGLVLASDARFEVAPAATASVPLRLQAGGDQVAPGSHTVAIEVRADDDATVRVRETTTFLGLRR
jgi:cytochrome c oxidase accessory protein FixG